MAVTTKIDFVRISTRQGAKWTDAHINILLSPSLTNKPLLPQNSHKDYSTTAMEVLSTISFP